MKRVRAIVAPLRRTRPVRSERHARPDSVVSLAGLIGTPVRDRSGASLGRLDDVVIVTAEAARPRVVAVVVRGGRTPFLPVGPDATLSARGVVLGDAATTATTRRPDEAVALRREVLDRQLVDAHGEPMTRANDLYLAATDGAIRLVGVDAGLRSLLRRLAPGLLRTSTPNPHRLIGWESVAAGTRSRHEPIRIERTRHELAPPARGRRHAPPGADARILS